ncbi:hypothetical protein GOODEAATRI_017834, partial [Goodea atripinnis]
KACILKCLLDIHKVFRENDPAYILNDLYITDYCIWIQRVKMRTLAHTQWRFHTICSCGLMCCGIVAEGAGS